LGPPPQLHALAVLVVHEKEKRAIVFGQIPRCDELLVSDEVRKRDRVLVKNVDEALAAAAMLDVGLTLRGGGCEVRAVSLGDEGREIGGDLDHETAMLRFHACV